MKIKHIISTVIIGSSVLGCSSQNKTTNFTTEVERWKKELLLNKEVGPPCKDNWEEWMNENPDTYFGIAKIESFEADINGDGYNDGLFFFQGDNCLRGSGIGSEFAMLVYSDKQMLLTNKNITKDIEDKIKRELYSKGKTSIHKVLIQYKALGKTVIGKYLAWGETDANCCPSSEGMFDFNPISSKIEI